MKTQVTKVEESKTFEMFKSLQNAGFEVKLNRSFVFSYDKDSFRLSISVFGANSETSKLFDTARGFEIKLSKYAHRDETHFEITKHSEFAELVEESVWMNYYNSVK